MNVTLASRGVSSLRMKFAPGLAPSPAVLAAAVVAATTPDLLTVILDNFLASLPDLPSDDNLIPSSGGWYRNGAGFVRIPAKS